MPSTLHTIKGYITYEDFSKYNMPPTISFQIHKPRVEYSPNTIIMYEHSFEVSIPSDFDPRNALIANLEEQKQVELAKFSKRTMEINDEIQKLLAIGNETSDDDIPF